MANKGKKNIRILPWICIIITLTIVGLRIIGKNDESISFYEDDSSSSEYVETQESNDDNSSSSEYTEMQESDEFSENEELLWQLAQNEEQIQTWGNELATIEQLSHVTSSHIVRVAF